MTVSRGIFVALAAALILAADITPAYAQGEDNPLEFRTEFQRIGLEVGLSSVWQSGRYLAGCGDFNEGAKINGIFALAYDYPIIPEVLRFEALLGYQGRSIKSTYNSRELVPIRTTDASVYPDVSVDFENVGEASFSYVFLLPSVKLYPTKAIYVGAGLSANLLMNASTQYTKNIISKTVDIPDVGLSEVFYSEQESSDPYSKVFAEEDRSDASSFGLDAAIFVGAELPIGRRLKLGPRLMYTIAMNPVLENPELKLNSLQFLVGVRFDLQD